MIKTLFILCPLRLICLESCQKGARADTGKKIASRPRLRFVGASFYGYFYIQIAKVCQQKIFFLDSDLVFVYRIIHKIICNLEWAMGSRREETYHKIQRAIINGTLSPGERLVEKRICDEFKVGRTPLREVLRQLEAEGYVDVFPNKGAVVRKMSLKEVGDIYDIVALLEGYATEIATRYITSEDKRKLRNIQNECKEAGRSKDYRKWLEKNALFHGYFPRLSGKAYLFNQIDSLRSKNYRYRLIAATIPGRMEKHIRAHEEILKAVFKMNARQAGNAMRRHVLYVKTMLIDILRQYPEL
jgi:DNA-binding GntR family transcriptional regulator